MSARVLAQSPPRPGAADGDRWWHLAACAGADTDLFSPRPDIPAREEAAKAYCAACPVTSACLRDALEADDRHAVRGGLTPAERRGAYPQSRRCLAGLEYRGKDRGTTDLQIPAPWDRR